MLKGHLDTLLLASLEDGPRHGYAVKQALRAAGRRRLAADRTAWREFATTVTAILEPAR